MIERWLRPETVEAGLRDLRSRWDELLSHVQVSTPDQHTDRMVNIWNAYQCMVTFNLSRSASFYESGIGRGMGFRDSNQDLLGFVQMVPERARQRILDLAATQLSSGGAYHQYQPLTKRGNDDIGSGFNDDPLWLVLGVAAYLQGDRRQHSILDEPVPYDNAAGSEAPLLDHLRRSVAYTLERLGPHGLPLIGRADWNDCLNLNCFSDTPGESFQTTENRSGGVAESVFIAGLFVLAARELAAVVSRRAEGEEARRLLDAATTMAATIAEHGWDGDWFRRAYDFFGEPGGLVGLRRGSDLRRAPGHVRDGRGRAGGRPGPPGARQRARPAAHRPRRGAAAAGLQRLPHRARRDLLVPPRLQGERRHLLPHQPVDHDRRGDDRRRRRGLRLLPPDQSIGPRGDQRGAPLRALRLRPDDRRARRPDPRRGQELVAHRHRRLELRGHHAVDPRDPAGARRAAHRPGDPRRLAGLHRHPAVPRLHLPDHRPASRREPPAGCAIWSSTARGWRATWCRSSPPEPP